MKPQALTSPLVGPPLKAQSSRPLLTAFFRPVPGLISRIGSSNFCAMDVVGYASPCRSRTLDDHDRAIICEKRREKGKREGTGTAHRRWSAAEESLLWEHGKRELRVRRLQEPDKQARRGVRYLAELPER